MEEDRGDPPQGTPLAHRLELFQQPGLVEAELGGGRGVGLGHDRHVALERPDRGHVELRQLDRVRLERLGRLRRGGECVGIAHHLQVHPDLEELDGGQLAHRLGAGQLPQHLESAVETQLRARLGGDREPEVEVVVAQVVVGDPGVGVDDLGRTVGVVGVHLRRDQHRAVAQDAGVEDRRDLADDALVDQALGAPEHLLLGHAGRLRDGRERPRGQWEAALQEVEQLLVELVERDRRAVLARAGLLPYWSHSATSLAK
jgi:hypothetical protein